MDYFEAKTTLEMHLGKYLRRMRQECDEQEYKEIFKEINTALKAVYDEARGWKGDV